MVTLAKIKTDKCDEYSEYRITTFYVNKKQVPRNFFYLVSKYYDKKYLKGFYSRKIKQCPGYFQIKYFTGNIKEE